MSTNQGNVFERESTRDPEREQQVINPNEVGSLEDIFGTPPSKDNVDSPAAPAAGVWSFPTSHRAKADPDAAADESTVYPRGCSPSIVHVD